MPAPKQRVDGTDPLPRWAAVVLLAALVLYTAIDRWLFLASSPYPWGIDGYFYTIQLRSVLESGGLHYPSAPLSFYAMAPLAAIGGAVWAVKITAAISSAVVALPIYGIGRELGCDRAPSLAGATIAACAPASFYFATEFVKNGVGMAVAAAAIWLILIAHRTRRPGLIGAAIAVTLAAWLTHKSAGALVALTTIPLAFSWLKEKRSITHIAAGVAAAVALIALVGALFPQQFAGSGDIALLGSLFSGSFAPMLPVLRVGESSALYFGHLLPIALTLAFGFWVFFAWRKPTGSAPTSRAPTIAIGLSLFLVLVAIPTVEVGDPNAIGFRLRLLAYVAAALLLAPVLTLVIDGQKRLLRASVGLIIAGFVFASFRGAYLDPVVEQHPALVDAVGEAVHHVPGGDGVVTPERRLVFMTTWLTRRRAAQDNGAFEPEKRWRLIPLPYISSALAQELNRRRVEQPETIISLHSHATLGLVLLRESTWVRVIDALPAHDREHYQRWPTY